MSDSIRELVQKGRLRERCAEPVQWTCAVCGTDTADNTQPCGVCCGTEFKPRCVRCDAVGVPGGERACESVAQYRLTGRMAFNDEPPPPPAAAKYPFRGRISKVVRAKNGAPRQLALHRKGGTDQRRINLDGGSLLFKAGRKVPHEDLAEGQTLNGLLRKDDGGQEWLVKAMVALEGRESEEAPPPPHPGNLWKCPECGTPTAAPGAAGAECPACLKTVRPLQANASPPPPPPPPPPVPKPAPPPVPVPDPVPVPQPDPAPSKTPAGLWAMLIYFFQYILCTVVGYFQPAVPKADHTIATGLLCGAGTFLAYCFNKAELETDSNEHASSCAGAAFILWMVASYTVIDELFKPDTGSVMFLHVKGVETLRNLSEFKQVLLYAAGFLVVAPCFGLVAGGLIGAMVRRSKPKSYKGLTLTTALILTLAFMIGLNWKNRPAAPKTAPARSPAAKTTAQTAAAKPATEPIRTLEAGHTQPIRALGLSPDGKTLLTSGEEGRVMLRDYPSGSGLRTVASASISSGAAAFSPDGRRVAWASHSGKYDSLTVYDLAQEKAVLKRDFPGEMIGSLVYTPSEGSLVLATTGADGIGIRQIDKDLNSQSNVILDGAKDVVSGALSLSGGLLAVAGKEGIDLIYYNKWLMNRITLIDKITWSVRGESEALCTMAAISADEKTVAGLLLRPKEATVCLWNAETCREKGRLTLPEPETVEAFALSPDSRHLAIASSEGFSLWDAVARRFVIRGFGFAASAVAFSPDGRQALASETNGQIQVWEVPQQWATRRASPRTGRENHATHVEQP